MEIEVSSLFYDAEEDFLFGFVEEDKRNHRNGQEKMRFYVEESFNGSSSILLQSEECLSLMIEKECEHMPAADYFARFKNGNFDVGARDEIIEWIAKVHSHFRFGPMCAYLSVNYLDRFLSIYNLPKDKDWMMHLLGVACLSLAVKMEETDFSLTSDIQVTGDAKYLFDARTVQKMEACVLRTLNWRMQAITPFSYIDYFLKKINDDQIASINQSVQLILTTLKGIHFLEFKPSEIAAAVAITVVAVKTETVSSEKAISALVQHVQKDKVMKCVELIQELSDSIRSPIDIFDIACLSCRTDESGVELCANSSRSSPVAKRRKLNTSP